MLTYYTLHARAMQHRRDLLREAKIARKLRAAARAVPVEAAPPGPPQARRAPALALAAPAGMANPHASD
jgi:hypothetical protein